MQCSAVRDVFLKMGYGAFWLVRFDSKTPKQIAKTLKSKQFKPYHAHLKRLTDFLSK